MNFFSQAFARWKSVSPIFFKKLTNFGVSLIATGSAAMAVPAIPNVVLPPFISTVGSYMIVAGVCVGLISKLTCQDPTTIDKTGTTPISPTSSNKN